MYNENNKIPNGMKPTNQYWIITPEGAKALREYQYSGADNSLLYKHILSPVAGWLVDHVTPSTLAPNTITLSGFMLMIASYLLISYHCPTLDHCSVENPVPEWIFLFHALALLIYQTLDNMDGKQARKTGSSSPLGLIFDHGCDAMNTIIGSVNILCAVGLSTHDNLPQIFACVFIPMSAFFVATWEEYHTGKLILPLINGPSEGIIINALVAATSWYFGRSFWHSTSLYHDYVEPYLPTFVLQYIPDNGLNLYTLAILFFLLNAINEVTIKIIHVTRKHGMKSMLELLPWVTLTTLSWMIVSKDHQVFIRHQRICLLLVASLFVEMVTALMLDHMTHAKNMPFRKVLVPLILTLAAVDMNVEYEQLEKFFLGYTIMVCGFLAIKTTIVIREICSILCIWCFDIVTPHPNKKSL